MKTMLGAGLAAQTIGTIAELGALAADWDSLYARASAATPFQSHAWIHAWWLAYGGAARLRLYVVRRDGRLVGVAPFMLRRRLGLRVLTPIGTGQSDFTDVLLDDEDAAATAETLSRAVMSDPGWDVIDIPEARPGSAAGRLQAHWPGGSWRLPASTCLQMRVQPIEQVLIDMGGRTAGRIRAGLRKIDAMNVSVTEVAADDAERGISELILLHAKQWENRGINEEHLRPQFRRHLTQAARRLIQQDMAVLTEYRIDGELVAANLSVVGKDFVGGYLYGAHPDLRAKLDILTLLISTHLSLTHRLGLPTLSFLRGSESHKTKWGSQPVINHRLILGRGLTAACYATAARCRRGAGQLVKERFPQVVDYLDPAKRAARRAKFRNAVASWL